jgi:hypothetical protein
MHVIILTSTGDDRGLILQVLILTSGVGMQKFNVARSDPQV